MPQKATESVLAYIQQEIERTSYGRIIIELNATANKIDIITEHRQRFQKNESDYNRG